MLCRWRVLHRTGVPFTSLPLYTEEDELLAITIVRLLFLRSIDRYFLSYESLCNPWNRKDLQAFGFIPLTTGSVEPVVR